jgi:hypothetical protein
MSSEGVKGPVDPGLNPFLDPTLPPGEGPISAHVPRSVVEPRALPPARISFAVSSVALRNLGCLLCANREEGIRSVVEPGVNLVAWPEADGSLHFGHVDLYDSVRHMYDWFESASTPADIPGVVRDIHYQLFIEHMPGVISVNGMEEGRKSIAEAPLGSFIVWKREDDPTQYGVLYKSFVGRDIGPKTCRPTDFARVKGFTFDADKKERDDFLRSTGGVLVSGRDEAARILANPGASGTYCVWPSKSSPHLYGIWDRSRIGSITPRPDLVQPGGLRTKVSELFGIWEREIARLRPSAFVDGRMDMLDVGKIELTVENLGVKDLPTALSAKLGDQGWEPRRSGRNLQYVTKLMSVEEAQLMQRKAAAKGLRGEIWPSSGGSGKYRLVFNKRDFNIEHFNPWRNLKEMTEVVTSSSDYLPMREGTVIHRFVDVACPRATSVDSRLHANSVSLSGIDQGFILTQAPLAETVEDFGRVAVGKGVKGIVDLTTPADVERKTIPQYVPGAVGETLSAGGMTLKCTAKDPLFTSLKCQYGGLERDMKHIRFGWRDMAGADASQIIGLMGRVQSIPGEGPVMIHCTAGVGRSGTLAVCLAVEECIQKGLITDDKTLREHVMKWVIEGRIQRGPGFVQRPEQLETILAVGEALLNPPIDLDEVQLV